MISPIFLTTAIASLSIDNKGKTVIVDGNFCTNNIGRTTFDEKWMEQKSLVSSLQAGHKPAYILQNTKGSVLYHSYYNLN